MRIRCRFGFQYRIRCHLIPMQFGPMSLKSQQLQKQFLKVTDPADFSLHIFGYCWRKKNPVQCCDKALLQQNVFVTTIMCFPIFWGHIKVWNFKSVLNFEKAFGPKWLFPNSGSKVLVQSHKSLLTKSFSLISCFRAAFFFLWKDEMEHMKRILIHTID